MIPRQKLTELAEYKDNKFEANSQYGLKFSQRESRKENSKSDRKNLDQEFFTKLCILS